MAEQHRIREEYDEWRRRNRVRHSEAQWRAFVAGFETSSARYPEMAQVAELPLKYQNFVMGALRTAIEVAKDQR